MKHLKNIRYPLSIVAACAALGMATDAKAQTVNLPAAVQVQNTLTLTVVSGLNWGLLAAFKDTGGLNVASVVLNPDGTLSAPTTTGAPAAIASIDNTAVTAGEITVEDAALNAILNITINNVVAPIGGGIAFALTNWRTSFPTVVAAPVARTVATPFQVTYTADPSSLFIGASLDTVAGGTQYTDTTYNGNFNVIFSY